MSKKLTRKEKIALQKQEGHRSPDKKKAGQKTGLVKKQLALIVAIFSFVIYSNTLNHGYVLDDYGLIKENVIVKKGTEGISEIFATSYRTGMNFVDVDLYRPLSKAMFAIEWEISPNNPSLSHWVNVIFYMLTCIALFFTLSAFMKGNLVIPFVCALLFAVHPIHTEVVANIKSRDEVMSLLFSLITAWCILKSYLTGKNRYFLLASLSFAIAIFSKESAIMWLIIIPLMLYYFTDSDRGFYLKGMSGPFIVALLFLIIRNKILGGGESGIVIEDNSLVAIDNWLLQKANAIMILGVYLKQLIAPWPLIADGSYNHFKEVGLTDWRFILPFLVLSVMLFIALAGIRKKDPVSFGLFYFFITIGLTSNVFFLIGTNYGERLLYSPSLGIMLVFAVLLYRTGKHIIDRDHFENLTSFARKWKLQIGVLAIVVFAYSGMTYARNPDWKDNMTLYTADLKKAPDSVHLRYYLANHMTSDEEMEKIKDENQEKRIRKEAIVHLNKCLEIHPNYADAAARVAFNYFKMNELDSAHKAFTRALEINPTSTVTLNNFGSLLFQMQQFDKALESFQKALRYNPRYAHAAANIGSVYGAYGEGYVMQAQTDPAKANEYSIQARKMFETSNQYFLMAAKLDPEFKKPYYYLSINYKNLGDQKSAEYYGRLAREAGF
ncbi:MAG: tetratricopeptide repeat protein [Bacteroidetes bacterium]|nr:MAG: tetratricopeptide repeat protein [Bacteroidota bacterium]REK05801.1 MAG: tetratricopeptide repeat protein [Bacteroidota bacterium]REK31895.1 MAG: tetratricopeptide repeat protein [Bacteroidota bacterium]REK49960.1 MAG: tetratricopeptide repeat protein [Bacteroidota bacterium]